MSKRHYKPEEIISKLRQVDVQQSHGTMIDDAIRQIGVTSVTYYRWRKEYGGLRHAVSDLTLDKLILNESAKGNF